MTAKILPWRQRPHCDNCDRRLAQKLDRPEPQYCSYSCGVLAQPTKTAAGSCSR